MMKWTNYHMHCHYCDGKDTVENHVINAIRNNVKSLGFSCHCPVPFENGWSMEKKDIPKYLNEIDDTIEKYREQIQIYKSLEIDYIPGVISPSDDWIRKLQLDYTIGSVHFVGAYENGRPWEIDGRHTVFLDGLGKIYHGDVKYVVSKYFQLIRQMVRESCPDIIGHLDKIKMQNHGLWREDDPWYKHEVLATLEEIRSSGSIVEVNTRGTYKKLTLDPYPGPWILRNIVEMNIPIHINSDAHTPSEIIQNFNDAAELLTSLGFKKLKILSDKKWSLQNFDKNGLQTA